MNLLTINKIFKNKAEMILAITIVLSILFGFLVFLGGKTSVGIILSIFFALICVIMVSQRGEDKVNKSILYFIIFSIPFPYFIQLIGRDAMTITSIMIYIVFVLMVISYLFQKRGIFSVPKLLILLPILIIINLTVSLVLNPLTGPLIKHYIANVSGILLYFLILATLRKQSDVIFIIRIILITLFVQSVISFMQLKFPEVARMLLAPFGTRVETGYAPIREFGIVRANGVVGDYELLAQMFLVGSILSIGLIYQMRRYRYAFPLYFCLAGILFTKTRSDLAIFILGFALISILLNFFKKEREGTLIKISILIITSGIALYLTFPSQINEFWQRLGTYFQSSNLISSEAINRRNVWEDAFYLISECPTLFGKSIADLESLRYVKVRSFHSLYFTILYRMGYFGLAIHVIFWFKMLHQSWHSLIVGRKDKDWYILFFLFIAVILMLVDGIKIEYLRYSHTIQFVWMIYALLIISSSTIEKNHENIVVS